jgi:ABC-type multidrug transport system ATPase subunit
VTHQIQFLRKATQILVLNEGKCMALGTFEELQKSSIDFMTLLNENKERESLETIRSRAKTELMVPNFVNEAKPRTKSELLTVSEDESRGRLKSLSIGSVESFKMPEVFITSFEFQLNCQYKSVIQFVYLIF